MVKLIDPDLAKLFLPILISVDFSIGTLNLMLWELHYITFYFIFVFNFEVSAVMVVLDCWLLIYPRGSLKLWSCGQKVTRSLFSTSLCYLRPRLISSRSPLLLCGSKGYSNQNVLKLFIQVIKWTGVVYQGSKGYTGSLDDLNEQFKNVLVRVTVPLTWYEFWRSRQGVSIILASLTSSVVLCMKAFNNNSL